jgi:hypothetical protein
MRYASVIYIALESSMTKLQLLMKGSVLMGLMALASACVVAPREGYWDRDHHRYYHDHSWHECAEHDEFCR